MNKRVGFTWEDDLITEYSPILVLHPNEEFRPVPVECYLQKSLIVKDYNNKAKNQSRLGHRKGELIDFNNSTMNDFIVFDYFDTNEEITTKLKYNHKKIIEHQNAWLAKPENHSAIYSHSYTSDKYLTISYYFFYMGNTLHIPSFNFLNGRKLFAKYVPYYSHDCDWEMIRIFFEKTNITKNEWTPKEIYLAQHLYYWQGSDRLMNWNEIKKIGNHPIIKVSLGGHTSFPNKGKGRRIKLTPYDGISASIILDPKNYVQKLIQSHVFNKLGKMEREKKRWDKLFNQLRRRHEKEKVGIPKDLSEDQIKGAGLDLKNSFKYNTFILKDLQDRNLRLVMSNENPFIIFEPDWLKFPGRWGEAHPKHDKTLGGPTGPKYFWGCERTWNYTRNQTDQEEKWPFVHYNKALKYIEYKEYTEAKQSLLRGRELALRDLETTQKWYLGFKKELIEFSKYQLCLICNTLGQIENYPIGKEFLYESLKNYNEIRKDLLDHFAKDISGFSGGEELLARVKHNLGNLFNEEGNFSESEKAFIESLELSRSSKDPSSIALTLAALSSLYSDKNDEINSKKYFLEAEKILKENDREELKSLYYNEAQKCLEKNITEDAILWANKAIKLNYKQPHIILATVYSGRGEHKKAIKSLDILYKLYEENPYEIMRKGPLLFFSINRLFVEVYGNWGLDLYNQGKPREGMKKFRQLEEVFERIPRDVNVDIGYYERLEHLYVWGLFNWSIKLLGTNQLSLALTKAEKALDIWPDFDRLYFVLGSIYERLGRYGESVENFEKGKELDSQGDNDLQKIIEIKNEEFDLCFNEFDLSFYFAVLSSWVISLEHVNPSSPEFEVMSNIKSKLESIKSTYQNKKKGTGPEE